MPTNQELIVWLWGLLGGVMRALDTAAREDHVPQLPHLLANVLVAGFCGFISSKVAGKFDPDWAVVAAGVGGYLGTTSIDVILAVVAKRRDANEK